MWIGCRKCLEYGDYIFIKMPIYKNLLAEEWDALGSWSDFSSNGGVSSISPAGQLYLDCRSLTDTGYAGRSIDFGSIGSGDYWAKIRFKGDVWDSRSPIASGFFLALNGVTYESYFIWGINDAIHGDGIWLYDGADYQKIYAHTWDNNWHTLLIHIHNSQTDMDIWVDDVKRVTDAVCTSGAGNDGAVYLRAYGSVAGNGEYHVDYLYIGDVLTLEIDVHDCGDVEEKMGG